MSAEKSPRRQGAAAADNPVSTDDDVVRLDLRRAADFMGISTRRLSRLRRRGEIPAQQIGLLSGSFRQPDLMAYVEKSVGIPPSVEAPGPDGAIDERSAPAAITEIVAELGPADATDGLGGRHHRRSPASARKDWCGRSARPAGSLDPRLSTASCAAPSAFTSMIPMATFRFTMGPLRRLRAQRLPWTHGDI